MPVNDNILGDWLYGDQSGLTLAPASSPATCYLVDLELAGGTEYISIINLNDVEIGGEKRQYKRRLLDISAVVESLPSSDYGVAQLPNISLKLPNGDGYYSALYNAHDWRKRVVRIRKWTGSQVVGSWRGVIADANMVDEAIVTVKFYDPSDLDIPIPRRTVSTDDWVPKASIAAAAGGGLLAGTYSYSVVAYGSDGSVLGISKLVQIDLNGGNGTATISWSAVDGVSYYRVFGRDDPEVTMYWEVAAGTETYGDDGTDGTNNGNAGFAIPNVLRPSVDLGKAYAIGIGEDAQDVPLRCVNEDFDNERYDYVCYGRSADGAITVARVKRAGLVVDPSEYEILQDGPYSGFLLVRFHRQQVAEMTTNYYEITLDMSRTVQPADTYNFVNNLAFLLSDATIGGGKSINADSFGVAATLSRIAPLKCSLVIDSQRPLRRIVDDLLWCIGAYIEPNSEGAYEIAVDQPVGGVSMRFDVKGEQNRQRIFDITGRGKTSLDDAINTFVLEYRKQRTWSAGGGSSESYTLKTSPRTVHGSGRDEVHQTDCVRDKDTADMIACFKALEWSIGDEKLTLECDKYATGLKRYQTIQFTDPVHGVDDTYQVTEVSGDLDRAEIKLRHYDDAIYTYTPGTLPADPGSTPVTAPAISSAASDVSVLSSAPAATPDLALRGLATVPSAGYIAISFDTPLAEITNVSLAAVGDSGRYVSANSVSGAGMTIYLFDVAGNPLTGDVYWKVEGHL